MKKFAAVLLVCAIAFTCSAFADAEITTTDKTLITFEGDWDAYFFAKVANTGDTAAYVEYGGELIGFDSDENIVFTESYVGTRPSNILLQPGEYAYVYEYIIESGLKTATVTDYKFSLGTDRSGYEYTVFPCEAELSLDSSSSYNNYVDVTFTNTAGEVLYGFNIVAAIYDQNSKLVFVKNDHSSSIGIHPDSTVTIKLYIDSDLVEYYQRNGIKLTTIDAMLYAEKK